MLRILNNPRLCLMLLLASMVLSSTFGRVAFADFEQGLQEYEGGKFVEARQTWTTAAINKSAQAQFRLGLMLANGEGGIRNVIAAYAWLSLASQNGVIEAGNLSKTLLTNHIPRYCQYEAMKLVREFKMGIFDQLTMKEKQDSRCWKFTKPNKS